MTTNDFTLRQLPDLTPEEKAAVHALHVEAFAGIASLTATPDEMEWSSGDYHFTKWDGNSAIAHVGVVIRKGTADGKDVVIGGIGDVCTLPAHQGKGLASRAITLATDLMREHNAGFALLVCRPAMVPYYERLGWTVHSAPVYVNRFGERIQYRLSNVMVLPLTINPASAAEIDLHGPPW